MLSIHAVRTFAAFLSANSRRYPTKSFYEPGRGESVTIEGGIMRKAPLVLLTLMIASNPSMAEGKKEPFQKVVGRMDLQKFLGSWYVVGLLPSAFEKGAANGIETYSLDEKGGIRVEYVFHKGGPEGKKRTMRQKGWIVDKERNTEWLVQPLWPLMLPYLIIDLAEDYRYTVVGTDNYKYLWIMSRTPSISEPDYQAILSRLAERGYRTQDIQRMPQVW
jgi:apolipoprotein D and lipocalin family protein